MCNNRLITLPREQINVKKERYGALDGLRAYAALGILLMHVQANMVVKPSAGYVTERLIPFFTDFTLLFMVVSGFSLCCGYYTRIKEGMITPNAFYRKRYLRILPFFALLCIIDLMIEPDLGSLCEVFSNMTLCFGLLPPDTEIHVIGVGWFLGVFCSICCSRSSCLCLTANVVHGFLSRLRWYSYLCRLCILARPTGTAWCSAPRCS